MRRLASHLRPPGSADGQLTAALLVPLRQVALAAVPTAMGDGRLVRLVCQRRRRPAVWGRSRSARRRDLARILEHLASVPGRAQLGKQVAVDAVPTGDAPGQDE
jgi:hypothetical protein